MAKISQSKAWRCGAAVTAVAAATTALTPISQAQEAILPPIERPAFELPGIETANPLRENALAITFGTRQTVSGQGGGTGNQIYYAGAEYGVTDRLSFGIWAESYEDRPITPINGATPEIGFDSLAAFGSYHLYDGDALDVAVKASVEFQRNSSDIWGTRGGLNSENIVGSVQVPVSYQAAPGLQLHVSPGVAVFPETLNGNAYYGVVPFISAAASYQFSQRFSAYGGVTVPFGPGGNSLSTTATIETVPVWVAGARMLVTPKGSLDFYVTNAIGSSPTSRLLTHWPDGNEIIVGIQGTWTPGEGRGYRDSYQPLRQLSAREISLQRNGFTLASADTFEPGIVNARAWYGSSGNYGGGLAWSPDQHGQVEFYGESYADDGSVPAGLLPTNTDERYMVGAKIRFLDQNLGDPFTLSARALGGRDLNFNAPGNGVIYAEALFGYKASPKLALTGAVKAAAFGNNQYYGLGLGVNYALFEGLELIGEVTPTDGANGTVWAAGARYSLADSGWAIDAHATNAIGHNGLGSMMAQDETKFAVSISKSFDISNWR